MKLLHVIAIALVTLRAAGLLLRETQPIPAAPAYSVHVPGLQAGVMSPDEKSLAVITVHKPREAAPSGEVQVWDFRTGSLVRAHSLPVPEFRPKFPDPITYIGYSSDGQLLAVYPGGHVLHVLRATDLEEVRTIQIHPPAYVNPVFELSPTARRLAVRILGDVRVYDLDSGQEAQSWSIHPPDIKMWPAVRLTPRLDGPGLAWRGDGAALAISVSDSSPCMRGGGTIYVLDLTSEKEPSTFRVPLLPASVAFGTGNRLYVASSTCGGVFTHWALDLPIFDSSSGQEAGKIPAGKVGVRNYVTISANKQTLLAYADREKTTFEGLEDTLKVEDAQWQVWDLATGKLVLSLPARDHESRRNYPSLSRSGLLVYANRGEEVSIFSVPVAAK